MNGDNQLILFDSLDASARLSNTSLLVVDFQNNRILHHTEKLLFIDRPVSKEINEGSYNPYWELAKPEDLKLISEVKLAYTKLLASLPEERKLTHVCTVDYHINKKNRYILITQKFTPLKFLPDGSLWLGLFSISPTFERQNRDAMVFGDGFRYIYDSYLQKFVLDEERMDLSEREKQILLLSLEGNTVEQIADSLFLSVNTVKTHKHRLFEKLQITSISEAYLYLSNYFLE